VHPTKKEGGGEVVVSGDLSSAPIRLLRTFRNTPVAEEIENFQEAYFEEGRTPVFIVAIFQYILFLQRTLQQFSIWGN